MITSFREFLLHGRLGDIRLQMARSDVASLLGDPRDRSVAGEKTDIMSYGTLELSFLADKLELIALYFDRGEPIVVYKDLVMGFVPSRYTGLAAFVRYLNKEGIPLAIDEQLTFDDQIALRVGCGVRVLFTLSTDSLNSAQMSAGRAQ